MSSPSRLQSYTDRAINLSLRYSTPVFNAKLAQSFTVPSHITLRERAKLHELATGRQVIVEIGSYIGASASAMASAPRAPGSKIYCIDTWENDAMSEGERDTETEFRTNVAAHIADIVMVKGNSLEMYGPLAKMVSHADLLFIDGDHSYEGAYADWTNYNSLLDSGSCVVFHDYGWAEGVQRVVHENAMPRVSAYGSLPNLWWGKIK